MQAANSQSLTLVSSPMPAGISPGLSDVAGVPLVTYWIQALRACPRLLPVAGVCSPGRLQRHPQDACQKQRTRCTPGFLCTPPAPTTPSSHLFVLRPAEKVYIVTSPDTHDTFLQWCSHKDFSLGFPPSNLINIGGPSAGLLADAAFAVQAVPGMRDGYVVVASLEAFLGPVIPLRQLVEHTVVRGKDTLAFYYPPPGSRMQGQAQVTFDMAVSGCTAGARVGLLGVGGVEYFSLAYYDWGLSRGRSPGHQGAPHQTHMCLSHAQATTTITGEYVNPRVGAVDAAAGGQADGLETTGMAPVLILHRSSVPLLEQAARSGGGPSPASSVSPAQQLGSFVQGVLIGNGKPVYGGCACAILCRA